jgi:hypothetical protein
MKTITLTPEQLEWLKRFLERADLKGREVPAFLEVAQKIGEAKDV